VASLTDSRTILDVSGAEKLLGRGDMLYTSAELSKPKRIQGAFCSDDDIEAVTGRLRRSGSPDYLDEVTEKKNTLGLGGIVLSGEDDEGEDRLGEARELIITERKASASYLQRRMKIGYAKAARILDLLEQQGVIGPADGAKPREILIKKGERDEAQEFIDQAARKTNSQDDNYDNESDYSGKEAVEEQETDSDSREMEESGGREDRGFEREENNNNDEKGGEAGELGEEEYFEEEDTLGEAKEEIKQEQEEDENKYNF